jgi:hypothetical protein
MAKGTKFGEAEGVSYPAEQSFKNIEYIWYLEAMYVKQIFVPYGPETYMIDLRIIQK